jgi:hypothetical protein
MTIDAERRIHQLEEQLRQARDNALEEAAKAAYEAGRYWNVPAVEIPLIIRRLKGTPT